MVGGLTIERGRDHRDDEPTSRWYRACRLRSLGRTHR